MTFKCMFCVTHDSNITLHYSALNMHWSVVILPNVPLELLLACDYCIGIYLSSEYLLLVCSLPSWVSFSSSYMCVGSSIYLANTLAFKACYYGNMYEVLVTVDSLMKELSLN